VGEEGREREEGKGELGRGREREEGGGGRRPLALPYSTSYAFFLIADLYYQIYTGTTV